MIKPQNIENGQQKKENTKSKINEKSKIKQEEFPKKSKFLCMFCGGKSCSKENYLKNTLDNAIHGLHSNWITPEILAMQRPSTRLVKEFNIIEQFKNAHIKAVFNLQLPGEHPYCGDSLIKESGFTYKPEDFTDHGIFYFNFGWTDMEVTNNDYMIKIISHVDMILRQGMKIAVHCHAGSGRTGLLIASWMILKNNMSAVEARDFFRSKRAGGLSKSKQLDFLKKFEEFLIQNRISFLNKNIIKIEDLIQSQEKLIFGKEKSESRYSPIIMDKALSRLESMIQNNRIGATKLCKSFVDINDKDDFDQWNTTHEQQLSQLKDQINKFSWSFSNYGDVRVISQVLLDFFDQQNLQAIKNESALKLEQYLYDFKNIEHVFTDDNIVQLLGRYEFSILSKFLTFIKKNFVDKQVEQTLIDSFILRVSISLLGKRKELDNLFIERSFLTTFCNNRVVNSLYQFMKAWLSEMVENNMTDNTFFGKLFNRTSTIIEGRLKQNTKPDSKIDQKSQNSLQQSIKNSETILIGDNQKKQQQKVENNQDGIIKKSYTNVNLPLNTNERQSQNNSFKPNNEQDNKVLYLQQKNSSQSNNSEKNSNQF